MKILFVMKYPLVDQYSIMQKLNGEINAVRRLGHEPYYISFDRENLYLDNGTERKKIQKTTFGHAPGYFHTIVFYDIYSAARKVIVREHFDLVYFRHSPLNLPGYRMIKAASASSKLVVEISSFPPEKEKAKNALRTLYFMMSRKWWKRSAKYVSLFTGIGEHADEYLSRPFLNIDNGIDLTLIPPRAEPTKRDGKIHLLAVASMCEWQGYERVINGMAEWNSNQAKNYVVDLVGDEGDGSLARWKKLAYKLELSNQIIFHGRMTGDALTEMYNRATIGLGTLAMHKRGFKNGSVLKLREYMARGLPFVYANEDPHLNEDLPWCIKIPDDDSAVNMEYIDEFIRRIKNEDGLSDRMREYAKNNMSWEKQFLKIFEWIQKK